MKRNKPDDTPSETLSRVAYGKERLPHQAERESRPPWLRPKPEKATKEFIRSLRGCMKGPRSALDLLLAERRRDKVR